MDPLLIFVIFGIVFALLFGAVIGYLIANMRKKEVETDKVERPEKQTARPSAASESVALPPAMLTNRTQEDFHPVVCLWRNRQTGKIATEIKGKLYLDPTPLSLEARRKLQDILSEWELWVDLSKRDLVERLRDEYKTEEQPEPVETKPEEKVSPLPSEVAAGAIPSGRREAAVEKPAGLKPMSIVEQIDEILQAKLAASPIENRAIRLIEEENQGVSVWVGLTRYNSIDEVEDEEAFKIIQSAVAEWEKQSGQKR